MPVLIIHNGTNEGRDTRLPPNQNPSGGGGQSDDDPSSDDDFGGDVRKRDTLENIFMRYVALQEGAKRKEISQNSQVLALQARQGFDSRKTMWNFHT